MPMANVYSVHNKYQSFSSTYYIIETNETCFSRSNGVGWLKRINRFNFRWTLDSLLLCFECDICILHWTQLFHVSLFK